MASATPISTAVNGEATSIESSHIKELARQIRNIHKKLSASSKADAVIAENPGKAVDELVAERKLNNDQKLQLQKKPQLQSQLVQLEEQLAQFRSFAQDLEERFNRERANLIEAHEAEIAQIREDAEAKTKAQEQVSESNDFELGLKIVSDFLHAAASKRNLLDDTTDERRAFEGALLLVYQGNEASLSTLHNLIEGTDDKVLDTEGNSVDFTFAQLRESSIAEAQASAQGADEPVEAPADELSPVDPTIANAGMTELEDTTTIAIRTNGINDGEHDAISPPEQASTSAEAANAVAEANWNPEASMTTDASGTGEEWVQVSRDPAETDSGVTATRAASKAENSWAEEVATSAEEQKKENDGFEQVRGRHGDNRGRGRGGRGGRGEFRGRGRGGLGRGSGEGRSRGGPRGGRGGPREARGDRS